MNQHTTRQKVVTDAQRLRDRARQLWRQALVTPVTQEHLRSLDRDAQRLIETVHLLEQEEGQNGDHEAAPQATR